MTVIQEDQVTQLLAAVESLPTGEPVQWSVAELEEGLPALFRVGNQLAALQCSALAAFDARGGGELLGHRSTADWLARTMRLSSAAAGALVHTSRALRDDLPETARALADGDISAEHVKAIRHAHRRLDDAFNRAEPIIVDYARTHTAAETRVLCDRLIQQYSPDDYENEAERARDRRKVFLHERNDGWWYLDGLLDAATGHKLAAAFEVFAEPIGPQDGRSGGMRQCDALGEIAAKALDPVDRPTGAGHVTLTLTPDQLESGVGANWPSGLLMSRLDLAVETCSAKVTYVVGLRTDDVHWAPLAVGFAERFATKAQRAALAVRDGSGCIHPGCTVPARRCIAHHIKAWKHGGPTDLVNLVLICRYHHRRVHQGLLRIVWTDGHYETGSPIRPPP